MIVDEVLKSSFFMNFYNSVEVTIFPILKFFLSLYIRFKKFRVRFDLFNILTIVLHRSDRLSIELETYN